MNEKFILCFLALLAALLQSIIIYNYLKMFFKKKANTKNTIVIAIFAVTTFSSFLTTIIVTPSFITACITLVSLLLFTTIFQGKFYLKALLLLLLLSIFSSLELFSMMVLNGTKHIYNQTLLNIYSEVIAIIIGMIIFCFFQLFIKRRWGNKFDKNIYALIVFPVIDVLIMAIIFQSNYLVNKEFVYEIVVLLSINTLACYYLMNEIDKAVVKNHKNEQIVQQLAQIQAQNIQLSRQYKLAFDVIHSENSFFTDLSQKKLTHSELMQLFEQRLTKINKILLEWGNPDQINNIQTVFDYFVQQAHAKNIEVVVNGQAEPIFKKKEAFLDIMTILTIILSNAIEHASDSKEHFLGINYLQNSHGALYTVTNSFTPNFKLKDYSLDALVQSGLDLRQVQKLVEELDGEVTTSAKDNFFKIEIQIPNN